MADAQHTLAHLDSQREIWNRKPLIRSLYAHYHECMLGHCCPGNIVEIGAGCGNLKSHTESVTSLDIVNSPWVDIVADAQALPFVRDGIDNLVMLDVLHHIPQPLKFLNEAAQVLKPGGRLVMLEPGITLLSRLFYSHFHPEPVDMAADVFAGHALSGDDPFASNQAIPTLLFSTNAGELDQHLGGLHLVHTEWLGPLSYPMSGGFRPWQLLTCNMLKTLLKLEQRLPRAVLGLTAFRLLTVLQKQA